MLTVSDELLARTFAGLQAVLPEEGVGLWSGTDGVVHSWTPLTNCAQSPQTRYDVHPQEWIDALRGAAERGEVPLALVHSHPTAPPVPSRQDRENWHYRELRCVIVSFATGNPVWMSYRFE